MEYKEAFLQLMLSAEVLRFGDFVTKSGRKTPFFINTGHYRTGEHLAALGGFYADCIRERVPVGWTALYGPAYKGIPLAVAASMALY